MHGRMKDEREKQTETEKEQVRVREKDEERKAGNNGCQRCNRHSHLLYSDNAVPL